MKRIVTLSLALAFVLGAVGAAQALDMKARGNFEFAFGRASADGYLERSAAMGRRPGDSMQGDPWHARQRTRVQIDFIASEQLKGVLMFEIGDLNWGRNGAGGASGGALDADGVNIKTKRAYLDFMIPQTDVAVRMGIQGLALPSATGFNNPIFNADVGAIVVSAPINDMFGITAFWARPFDAYGNDPGNNSYDDEVDMFGLLLPVKGEGWAFTPWGVYAKVGSASGIYNYLYGDGTHTNTVTSENENADAWWLGAAFELKMFDPLTFGVDVAYGRLGKNDVTGLILADGTPATAANNGNIGTKGWFVDAALNYKLDWATPGIFGWYSTGDDYDDVVDKGWMGRIATPGGDMGFKPTSFGFAGSNGRGTDDVVSQVGTGTWGVGAQLADISFVDKLSHTVRVAYYQGTNDHELVENGVVIPTKFDDIYLTDKDNAWEVNIDHKYDIYENLTVFLEMGYIRLDLDKNTWRDGKGLSKDARQSDMWKSQLLFQYRF